MIRLNFLLLCFFASSVHAFWLDSATVEMPSEQNKTLQTVNNPDTTAHIMTVAIERIKDPYKMEAMEEEVKGEVLFTPARAIVGPKKDMTVSFTYHGLEDDKERYYRIIWGDQAFSMVSKSKGEKKEAVVGSSSLLSTVLVVHPRNENFKYELKGNELVNLGNSTFRFSASGACLNQVEIPKTGICREVRYLPPHTTRKFKIVDMSADSSKLGIWHNDAKYIVVR